MRESVGGAWIYGLVLGFVLLFTSFIALAINYNKVFKVKNEVLSMIEKYNGVNEVNKGIINNYLNNSGYSMTNITCSNYSGEEGLKSGETGSGYINYQKDIMGINPPQQDMCIRRVKRGDSGNVYAYDIILFYDLDVPIIGDIFKFKVTGRTQDIYYPNDIDALNR